VVEVWAEDEGRLGLKPITRRLWFTKGTRPIALQRRRYQWLQLYSFVHPSSGRSEWFLLPFVNVAAMQAALTAFARYANPSGTKSIVLLVDRAGWHTSPELNIPDGLFLFPLPPYTPELQPVECAWPLVRESVANQPFDNLGEMEKVIVKRCRYLIDHQNVLKGAVGFDWIIRAESGGRD
jgi:hypothetical protein